MKLTSDQLKALRAIEIYAPICIIGFAVSHLIKGDFNWADFLINAAICVATGGIIAVFTLLGMRTPKK